MEGNILSPVKRFSQQINSKINSIALSMLLLPVIALAANGDVLNNQVVNKVTTNVTVFYDGKTNTFDTNALNLGEAISQKNISLESKDAVEPSVDTNLSGGRISANITRALPVALEDNGKKSIIFSGYTDPGKILNQNGITTYPEDRVSSDLVSDFFVDGSLGRKIIIDRAPVFYINVDGGRKEFRSWSKTAGELLKEKGIIVGDRDKIEPNLNSIITSGIEITITRVAESEVKESEVIPFDTQKIEDPNTDYGKTYVKQDGREGTREYTYKIVSENGAMVSKSLVAVNVTSAPQTKIIALGTKIRTGASYTGRATYYYGPTQIACNLFKRGTKVKVINLNTSQSGIYTVDDSGGFGGSTVVDLRQDIYQELGGNLGAGSFSVKIEQVLN